MSTWDSFLQHEISTIAAISSYHGIIPFCYQKHMSVRESFLQREISTPGVISSNHKIAPLSQLDDHRTILEILWKKMITFLSEVLKIDTSW